jgi:hypothetical protein
VGTLSSGLLISTDGGATWTQAAGVPADAGIQALAFDPRHLDLAYATTSAVPHRRGITSQPAHTGA